MGEHEQQALRQSDDPRVWWFPYLKSQLQSTLAETRSSLTTDDRQLADAGVRRCSPVEGTQASSLDSATKSSVDRFAAATFAFHPAGQTLLVQLAGRADDAGQVACSSLVGTSFARRQLIRELNVKLAGWPCTVPLYQAGVTANGVWPRSKNSSQTTRTCPVSIDSAGRRGIATALGDLESGKVRCTTTQDEGSAERNRKAAASPSTDLETVTPVPHEWRPRESIVGPRFSAMLVSHDFDGDHLAVVDHHQAWSNLEESVPIGSAASVRAPDCPACRNSPADAAGPSPVVACRS